MNKRTNVPGSPYPSLKIPNKCNREAAILPS
jgi:hypothetical protein